MATSTIRDSAIGAPEASSSVVDRFSYVEWGPVIAGTIGATALSFVLLTFGTGIGLSAVSPWPNTGVSLTGFLILTALWVALVQVLSLAAGGYIAGRMRTQWTEAVEPERQFRDGAHGFIVWGLAVILGAWLVTSTTAGGIKTGVQAGATVAAGVGSHPDGQAPTDYAVDYLLRPGSPVARSQGIIPADSQQTRAEVARILAAGLRDKALMPRDRTYLVQLVSQRSGFAPADAEKRVDEAFAEAQLAENRAREAADKVRKGTAVAAFLAAATLLISCAAAAAGSALGGRHRNENTTPRFFGRQRFW